VTDVSNRKIDIPRSFGNVLVSSQSNLNVGHSNAIVTTPYTWEQVFLADKSAGEEKASCQGRVLSQGLKYTSLREMSRAAIRTLIGLENGWIWYFNR